MKKISVIIPAWNEEKFVPKTISALLAQDYPREDFEIIVSDNNSNDKTSEVAKNAGADKVVFEKEKGTNVTRNRGAHEASAEILAFLDADCIPPPDWLRKIEKIFENPKIAAVSGPYDYEFRGIKKLADKFYIGLIFKTAPKIITFIFRKKDAIIIGGNFAVRKSTFETMGEFPRFRFYGDDTAIAIIIVRKIGEVLFDPNLIVKSSSRRLEKQGFFKIGFNYIFHHFKVYFSNISDTIKK